MFNFTDRKKPEVTFPLLKSHGLYLICGGKAASSDHDSQPRKGGETGAISAPGGALRQSWEGGGPRQRHPGPARTCDSPCVRGLPRHVLPASRPPRGARPRRRRRSKWRWRRRAAGYETRGRHMAAPAPNLAGSAASRRLGEAGLGRKEAARRPPLTHGPVAQDRDLPGLGLRHLGGLLRPGPTTSTAAAAPPVLRSAAAAPGQSGIQGRGGRARAGAAASAPSSRAQPPGTAAWTRPQTRPRDLRPPPGPQRLASASPPQPRRPPPPQKSTGGASDNVLL